MSGPGTASPASVEPPWPHGVHTFETTDVFVEQLQVVFAPPGSSPAGFVEPPTHAVHTL